MEKLLYGSICFMIIGMFLVLILAIFTDISDVALKKLRPEIFNQSRNHEKQLNKMRRELNKALSENTQLKKQMNTFTYTQPKTDHNVYIKKNDY